MFLCDVFVNSAYEHCNMEEKWTQDYIKPGFKMTHG